MYPVLIPQLCENEPILDSWPDKPAIIKSFLFLIGDKLLNFDLLSVCCQFNHMLDNAPNGVSPPLRPIVPSSLNSPYNNSVPYIGAWPYRSIGLVVVSSFDLPNIFWFCRPKPLNAFCVIVC